jgi:hypothetical protein
MMALALVENTPWTQERTQERTIPRVTPRRSRSVVETEAALRTASSAGALEAVGAVLQVVALGMQGVTLCVVLLTAVSMVLLGPFGFFPALLVAPLFLMAEAASWISEAIQRRTNTPRRNDMMPQREPTPPKRKLLTKTRPERTPGRLDRAFEAHQSLPRLLDDLADPSNPLGQPVAAESLRRHLIEHFAEEEESGGLFEEIISLKPDLRAEIEAREEEHDEILIALNEVLRGLRKGDPGVEQSVERLTAKVRAHQRAEDQLFEQAYGICVGVLSSV